MIYVNFYLYFLETFVILIINKFFIQYESFIWFRDFELLGVLMFLTLRNFLL